MATINGSSIAESLNGTSGDDIINALGGDDVVHAGDGNDIIDAGSNGFPGSHDLLYGEGGNDLLIIYPADGSRVDPFSLADGGAGNDTAELRFANFGSALTYVHNTTFAEVHCGRIGAQLANIESIVFFAGMASDNITGGVNADQLYGGAGDDTLDGGGGSDVIAGGTGSDIMRGGTGDDILVLGSDGNDTLDGGDGIDTVDVGYDWVPPSNGAGIVLNLDLTSFTIAARTINLASIENVLGTAFGDTLRGTSTANILSGLDGADLLQGLGGNDTLNGGIGNDRLEGGDGDDLLYGGTGDDTIIAGVGRDVIDGGDGNDTIVLAGKRSDYVLTAVNGRQALVGLSENIQFTNIEQFNFTDANVARNNLAANVTSLNGLAYIASYADLRTALGVDGDAGIRHYLQSGAAEGRSATFDPLAYIASYRDLSSGLGSNADAGARHFIQFGVSEGRATTFDPLLYIASHPDLVRAFGANADAGSKHYIEFGAKEGRTMTFDALGYIASYADLTRAFGDDADAGIRHYIQNGFAEGRQITFDPLKYGAGYLDLARVLGDDATALTKHYLDQGFAEGRSANPGFDAVGYLLNNSDLTAANLDADSALRHWLRYGADEGRTYNPFGSEQLDHAASVGRVSVGTFDQPTDRDWFAVNVSSGQKLALAVLQPELVGSVISGAGIKLYDANGHLLSNATMSADGFGYWLPLTAAKAGVVYVEVDANGLSGSYQLAVAQVGRDYVPGAQIQPGGSFIGGGATDVFLGGNGHTNIDGGAGRDILGGGPGQDDFMGGPGADYMEGGDLTGADGTVSDNVSYQFSPAGVTAYLDGRPGVGGYADGDRIFGVESLSGSGFADKLYGTAGQDSFNGYGGNDEIYAGDGNDYISGGDGDDKLYGGLGNDRLSGDAGADLLDGGDGFDVADYQISTTAVRVDLRSGAVLGGASGDTLIGIEGVGGSYAANDILATAAVSIYQELNGYGGNDILIDRTIGSFGASLYGNGGDDLLIGANTRGDEGNDILVAYRENFINRADGQTGSDTYVIETSRHAAGIPFDFTLYIPSFDKSDKIDFSQLRDEGGRILDMADISLHTSGNVIDLTGFRTASGASVFGSIELDEQTSLFAPIRDFDMSGLSESNFIFSNGINWQNIVPSDFVIF